MDPEEHGMFLPQPAQNPILESPPLFFNRCVQQDRDSLGTGTISTPAAADALLLEVWPKQRVWPPPPSSSSETQDQYSHPQLKVPAPSPHKSASLPASASLALSC